VGIWRRILAEGAVYPSDFCCCFCIARVSSFLTYSTFFLCGGTEKASLILFLILNLLFIFFFYFWQCPHTLYVLYVNWTHDHVQSVRIITRIQGVHAQCTNTFASGRYMLPKQYIHPMGHGYRLYAYWRSYINIVKSHRAENVQIS